VSDHDLTDALRLVADVERPTAEATEDLERARAARRRRSARRVRLGAAATGLAAVAVLGASRIAGPPEPQPEHPAQIRLVSARVTTQPYTFGLIPQGWSVQGQTAFSVTIAPDDGNTSPNLGDFEGKLVILYDRNGPTGDPVTSGGTSYWIHQDSGYTTVSTRTGPAEPAGMVRVQYPDHAGWSRDTMLAFLGSVQVNPGARPGRG
jgi:hypothetical protein